MITREESLRIWEDVKRNHALLDGCSSHNFATDLEPNRPLNKKWQCTNCGGSVSAIDKMWYERGKAHGSLSAPETAKNGGTT